MSTLDLREAPEGVMLPVFVVTRAGQDAIARVDNGVLRVRVGAAPVEGAANRALLALLSESLRVPPRDLQLVHGQHSRRKIVLVRGISVDDLRGRLAARL